jgi:hypothetical protein
MSPRTGISGLTMRFHAFIIAVLLAVASGSHALEPPEIRRLGCFKDTSVLDLDGYL